MQGLFITFEGPDGSGKSTQIKMLADLLSQRGMPHILTREPGGTEISDAVRSILLSPENKSMAPETEALLYASSRAQHVREKIIPALKEGKIVLCDRFVDASIAYQGNGLALDLENVHSINRFATGGLEPDRTYMIDISPEAARDRISHRSKGQLDRIEQRQLDYHRKVRQAFHHIYNNNRHRICLIDGARSQQAVFHDILEDFEAQRQR